MLLSVAILAPKTISKFYCKTGICLGICVSNGGMKEDKYLRNAWIRYFLLQIWPPWAIVYDFQFSWESRGLTFKIWKHAFELISISVQFNLTIPNGSRSASNLLKFQTWTHAAVHDMDYLDSFRKATKFSPKAYACRILKMVHRNEIIIVNHK